MAETTGFDLNFCQLETGNPTIKTKTTILPSVVSSQFLFDKTYYQKGIAPKGYASFGMMTGSSLTRFAGKDYGSSYLFDFNGRSGFETISNSPFTGKSIHLSIDRLHDTAETNGISSYKTNRLDYAYPWHIDPPKLQLLQDSILNMETLVTHTNRHPQDKFDLSTIEDDIYRALICCLDTSQEKERLLLSQRLVIKKKAVEYIQSHFYDQITVTDICRACATTTRTLERVFREELNLTPKQFLTKVRLSNTRLALLSKEQELNITDIAASCGLLHASQFAKYYKAQYGELPSQTLMGQGLAQN